MGRAVKYGLLITLLLISTILSVLILSSSRLWAQAGVAWEAIDVPKAVAALLQTKDFPSTEVNLIPGQTPRGGAKMGIKAFDFFQASKLSEVRIRKDGGVDKIPRFKIEPRVEPKARTSAFPTLKVTGDENGATIAPGDNAKLVPLDQKKQPATTGPFTGTKKLTAKAQRPSLFYFMVFDPDRVKTFPVNGAQLRKFVGRMEQAKTEQRSGSVSKILPGAVNNEDPAWFQLRVRFNRGVPTGLVLRELFSNPQPNREEDN